MKATSIGGVMLPGLVAEVRLISDDGERWTFPVSRSLAKKFRRGEVTLKALLAEAGGHTVEEIEIFDGAGVFRGFTLEFHTESA